MLGAASSYDLADDLVDVFARIRGLNVESTIRARLYRRAIVVCDAAKRDSAVTARAIARLRAELDSLDVGVSAPIPLRHKDDSLA